MEGIAKSSGKAALGTARTCSSKSGDEPEGSSDGTSRMVTELAAMSGRIAELEAALKARDPRITDSMEELGKQPRA